MPYRKIPLAEDNCYHIYNRGNNKQKIFLKKRDYNFFLTRIQQNLTVCSEIISYCLMPNHFHFIAKIIDAEESVLALKKTFISYAKVFNLRYNRTGHLFEGRYKYKIIPENNYLLHLSRYVHLNPVRSKLRFRPSDWQYSSYLEFIGKRNIDFIKPDIVLSQTENYKDFVESFQSEQFYYLKKLLY